METSKISNWVQIGANVGIFAGLLLVALQMQQNSQLMRLQLLKEEANNYIASEFSIAGESYAEVFQKMLEEPENLSLSEMRVMESKLWGHNVQRWWGNYRLYEAGLVEASEWKAQIDADLPFAFGNPYSRAWWDVFRTYGFLPEELADYIDSKVEESPLNGTVEYYRDVQIELSKY